MEGNFVAYYRVFTRPQRRSGLRLESQQQAVHAYLNGGDRRVVGEFVEVESGKHNDRPKLAEALTACRVQRATLIIAKLDQLARNVAFVSDLMKSGVDFVAVDFPQANRRTIHLLVALAERQAKLISERTKAGLAAAKRRGVKVGGFRRGAYFPDEARRRSGASRTASAERRAADIAPIISDLRAKA